MRRNAAACAVLTLIALTSLAVAGCDPCSSCKENHKRAIVCGQVPPLTTGAMYVSDSGNSRVLEYLPPFATGMSASVVFGQPDFTTSGGNATQNGMGNPEAVAVDGYGDIWAGDFYFGRAVVFVPPFSNGMYASLEVGQPDFTTPGGGTASASIMSGGVVGVAIDQACNLWTSDFYNNRVMEFVPPFTNAMDASTVIGQPNFTSTASGTTQNGLNLPQDIAFDALGDLWVADYVNSRVLEYQPPLATGMNASIVIGQSDFTSGGPGTSAAALAYPFAVTFDALGDLWVADAGNNRVLEFKPPFTSGMSASVVIGQDSFDTNYPGSGPAGLSGVSSVALDSSGNLYTVDANNSRVLIYDAPLSTGMSASVAIGQSDLNSSAPATTAQGLRGPLGVTIGP
jgi:NHL repeat